MSWQPAAEPTIELRGCPGLATVIAPRPHDIGGFEVRRMLPSTARRSVGPFVFWDQMGPADLAPGRGLDVRPHPHIGLATITYLFAGTILHRDSLGSVQPIEPGDVHLHGTETLGVVVRAASRDSYQMIGFVGDGVIHFDEVGTTAGARLLGRIDAHLVTLPAELASLMSRR